MTDKRKKKRQLFRRQRGRCAICEQPFDVDALTIDHVVPRSKGGSHRMRNLQLLCRPCNEIKADSDPPFSVATRREQYARNRSEYVAGNR